MIDIISPDENYTVARYADEALKCIWEIIGRGKLPIVCGGTGFYWRTLYRGGSDAPEGNEQLRAELDKLDSPTLHAKLTAYDPVSAARLHLSDRRRTIRALEVYELSGRPLSEFQAHGEPRFDADVIALNPERSALYKRIDRRVDEMIASGLINEIRDLLDSGISPTSQAMQAIGYKEFIPVIQGEQALDTAIETCKMNTRRYAKRQLTWLRREDGVQWL